MMILNLIVAFGAKNFGIGKNGQLPWYLPDDLRHFASVTAGSVVIMGYNTWMSIPEDRRPLKNRLNIVITSREMKSDYDNLMFMTIDDLDDFIIANGEGEAYIIGGAQLYEKYMGVCDRVYATVVDKTVDCDVFLPVKKLGLFEIESYSELKRDEVEGCSFRYITYRKSQHLHDEYCYLNLLNNVMNVGKERPDRTGVGTKSMFAPNPLRFDLSGGVVPIVTTKFVGIKLIIKELLWFLKGCTDSKLLEAQGVNIWKGNTSREFLDKRGLADYREGDIGSMYGWIWRHVGAEYRGCDADYTGEGHDQIDELIEGLKTDPYSRRHMITTYCPIYNDGGVLLPCHGIITQFYVEDGGLLSCHVYCRSQDLFLGQVINFASYSILTHIIAKKTGLKAKQLVLSMGDAHIYLNHIEQVKLQLSRSPLPFPVLEIADGVAEKKIDDIVLEDFNLVGYLHHPVIKAEMAV